ncbi:MAG: leucine-rich repeat protein, partial [Clostridia bacterium]
GEGAFNCCPSLIEVLLSDSLPDISSYCFNCCSSLSSITIPESVTSIGECAFSECPMLSSIAIPNSVTSIGNSAFQNCTSLESIALSASLTEINGLLLYGCSALLTITIPESVTSVYDCAFQECIGITSITIPSSVTDIGFDAFSGCSSLSQIIIDSETIANSFEDSSSCGNLCENATEVWILDSITEVSEYITSTFSNVTTMSIGSFNYNKYAKQTYDYNFSDGSNNIATYSTTSPINYDNLPEMSVEGKPAFYGLYSDSSFENKIEYPFNGSIESVTTLYAKFDVLQDNVSLTLSEDTYSASAGLNSSSIYKIPERFNWLPITSIDSSGFAYCEVSYISIPSSVISIGSWAFNCCSGSFSISSLGNISSIDQFTFKNCTGLTSITIPSNVKTIGSECFEGCSNLTNVVFEEGVTTIYAYAFQGCSALTNITIPSSVKIIYSYVFKSCSSLANVILEEGVEQIGIYAFQDCTSLASVNIPSSVISMGNKTIPYYPVLSSEGLSFIGCTNLTSIMVSENNANYSSQDGILFDKTKTILMFCPAGKIGSYEVPSSVTTIESSAFLNCIWLTNIIIPSTVSSFGSNILKGCTSLISMTLPFSSTYNSSTNSYLQYYFGNSTMPASYSVSISNQLTTIGSFLFRSCSGLTSITMPNSITSIGTQAFYGCSGITSITIPNNVTSIENQAFYGCSGITSIAISSNVTSIGTQVFYGCTNMTSIIVSENNANYSSQDGILFNKSMTGLICCPAGKMGIYEVPSSVTSVGLGAFYGCTGLTSVTIPSSVASIGSSAFYGCSNLKNVTINSSTISNGLTSNTVYGNLIYYFTAGSELYILDSIETIGSYVTDLTKFNAPVVVDIGGVNYKKFVKV